MRHTPLPPDNGNPVHVLDLVPPHGKENHAVNLCNCDPVNLRKAPTPGPPVPAYLFAEKFTMKIEIKQRPGITSRPFPFPSLPLKDPPMQPVIAPSHEALNPPLAAESAPSPGLGSYSLRGPQGLGVPTNWSSFVG